MKAVINILIQFCWIALCVFLGHFISVYWFSGSFIFSGIFTVVFFIILYLIFNPNTKRIRIIQTLINKDRSVCDVINSLINWEISNVKSINDPLVIVVNPVVMPMYKLYITYKGLRPTNGQISELYYELTNDTSVVSMAHKANMPVEEFMERRSFQQ